MTPSIGLVLGILLLAIVLFSIERFPADVVALAILVILILTESLPAEQALAGFGSPVVLMILGLLILTAALERTGAIDRITRLILRRAGGGERDLLLLFMGAAAMMSSLISNTATTALFVPIVLDLNRRGRARSSRLLLPLAFASILASSVTLVGSSTNLVVSGLMSQYGQAPLRLFELTPVGLSILAAGLVYMLFVGRRLLPERSESKEDTGRAGLYPYVADVWILPKSPLIGKSLAESDLGHRFDLTVLRVARGESRFLAPPADMRLEEGDLLSLEGHRDDLLKAQATLGLAVRRASSLEDPRFQTETVRIVETILLPGSPLVGKTLQDVQFRQRYGLQVVGLNRHGETISHQISQVRLHVGDQLLVQGHRVQIASLEEDTGLRVIGAVDYVQPNIQRAPLAVVIFVGTMLLAALDILSLPVATLLGALVAFVSRCIHPEEAYRQVEWRALILIACMLSFGAAMEYTGTAEFLARGIIRLFGSDNPIRLLSAFFALTMLLTQPLSNQTAAVIVTPIAIQAALQAGWNPRTFAVMIALGASCSFVTPLEPSCLLVYGPGRYRFADFIRVGTPLTVLIYIICIVLVPLLWPL